ncbi:MAG: 30S ribosomal protein S4 [Patescibacteria group bacterium]
MARYTGPKCRLCRREGQKLYLKGSRCESEKCAITRRGQAPGQHGTSRRRMSQYGLQFREKQKAKRTYGILEKQFRGYVDQALKSRGVTGTRLVQQLESRFDNMVYRSGFAVSRAQARQFIRSGFFTVNGKVVTIPSMQLKVGDIIKPVDFGRIQLREGFILPEWLQANVKEKFVKFERMPELEDLSGDINVQLIVEFYSR